MQDEEIGNKIDVTLLNPNFEIYKVKLTPEFLQKMRGEKITPPCNLNDAQRNRPFAICFTDKKDFVSMQKIMNQVKDNNQQEKIESFILSLKDKTLSKTDVFPTVDGYKTEYNETTPLISKTKNQVDNNKHKMYKTEETGYDNPAFERD